ncbi:alpha/beta hydrolase [Phaeovulum sp.]|uniref:alpha/beta hydrolase n=1 Tax=Phaeovulum sp. TaxID=2934796 RepID=UPI0035686528
MSMDRAYTNSAFIPGGDGYAPRWAAAAAAFRESHPPERLTYGPAARNWADLFHPKGAPHGLVVFVHGGYWLRLAPDDFSHLAAGALAAGYAVALPAYTLAPAARIGAITAELAQALGVLASRVAGPIHIAGHSAGGHLAARMACADLLPEALAARVVRVLPISPVADLSPLMLTEMQADLRLDAAEVAAESPVYLPRRAGMDVRVWVGGAERPAFLAQAGALATAWGAPLTVEPDRHHFDVIEGLAAKSPLLSALIG